MADYFKEDWDKEYLNYIKNLDKRSLDTELKADFLRILENPRPSERELEWNKLKINVRAVSHLPNLANPYFIGFGNPKADILILGKEKGFDVFNGTDLLIKESINNTLHWKLLENYTGDNSSFANENGFNPRFPRYYNYGKLPARHTWSLYAEIVAQLKGLQISSKELFQEEKDVEKSLFNYCFISEINHIPSKYSNGGKLVNERKTFLKQGFYKKFSYVIIGAKSYLKDRELIKNIFKVDFIDDVPLGRNKARELRGDFYKSKRQKIIVVDQLSGAAGWPNEALNALVAKLKSEKN